MYQLPPGITPATLKKMATRLCQEVDAVEDAKSTLSGRWRQNERLYFVDSSATGMILVEGMPPYAVPTQRTKIDRLVGSTLVACTSVEPYVQVMDDTPTGDNVSDIETSLMTMATENDFSNNYSQSLRVGALSNIGILRCVMTVDEGNEFDGGLQFDWTDPQNFMAYPIAAETLKRAKTCGHRTWEMAYVIEEKIKDGEYIDPEISIEAMADDAPPPPNNTDSQYDKSSDTTDVSPEDGIITEWDLITTEKVNGKWRKYSVLLAYDTQKILRIEEWNYSRVPYAVTRFVRTEKRIFGNDSVAQLIQGMCQMVNDLLSAGVHGTLSTSMPLTFVIGGLSGGKAISYAPGKIIPLSSGSSIQQVRIDFNFAGLVQLIQLIEPWIDGAIGISRVASSQELSPNTKATTVRAMVAADSQKQDQYLEVATESMVDMWQIMYEYLIAHFDVFKKRYGNLIPLEDDSFKASQYRFKATAMSASSQNALLQKLQTLGAMAQNPASTLDPQKVEIAFIEGMDLPMSAKTLQKDIVTKLNQFVELCKANGIPVENILAEAAQKVAAQQQALQLGHQLGQMPDDEPQGENDGSIDANGDAAAFSESGMGGGGDSPLSGPSGGLPE